MTAMELKLLPWEFLNGRWCNNNTANIYQTQWDQNPHLPGFFSLMSFILKQNMIQQMHKKDTKIHIKSANTAVKVLKSILLARMELPAQKTILSYIMR